MKTLFPFSTILVGLAFLLFPKHVSATTYYVSPSGSDNNNGQSTNSAFRNISKAISVLSAGDTLQVAPGSYTSFTVSKSGTSSAPINILATNALIDGGNTAINLSGSFLNIAGFEVANTSSHAVLISGKNITFKNFIVRNSVNENMGSNGSCSGSGGWGSGLKVMVGGENILLENGSIYRNCGEGLGITRGINITARNLTAYDNFSVNFYLDNSRDVTLENSLTYCTTDSRYYRNGQPASGILIGEESYSGWGAQLTNLRVINNLSHGCKGLSFYGAEVSPGGLKSALIAHNTIINIYNGGKGISIAAESDNRDIKIHNNLATGSIASGTGITASHNLTNPSFSTTPTPSNPLSFMPTPNSNAHDQGVTISGLSRDYRNQTRPQGSAPDIGAFEITSNTSSTPTPTPLPSPKPGDLNNDGSVNLFDFNMLVANFGNPYTIFDFNKIVSNYGK